MAAGDPARAVQGFMALPERAEDGGQPFLRCLADVVQVLGLDVAPEWGAGDRWTWDHRARAALRKACCKGLIVSEASFDTLIKGAVHDPNPSFNRQFIEPALNAFGCWRVPSALLDYLRMGTDLERAGAARAWYWSALPLRLPQVRAESQGTQRQSPMTDPLLCVSGTRLRYESL